MKILTGVDTEFLSYDLQGVFGRRPRKQPAGMNLTLKWRYIDAAPGVFRREVTEQISIEHSSVADAIGERCMAIITSMEAVADDFDVTRPPQP